MPLQLALFHVVLLEILDIHALAHSVLSQLMMPSLDGAEEPSNAQSSDILIRRRILADNPDLLEQFSRDVLPLLLQVYGATVVAQVLCMPSFYSFCS